MCVSSMLKCLPRAPSPDVHPCFDAGTRLPRAGHQTLVAQVNVWQTQRCMPAGHGAPLGSLPCHFITQSLGLPSKHLLSLT